MIYTQLEWFLLLCQYRDFRLALFLDLNIPHSLNYSLFVVVNYIVKHSKLCSKL